ncbi:hypothetical protein GF377_01660 [candidate division GN15 bacterium]|nr:hypothetical protein [candidate division GN15 bacterium]
MSAISQPLILLVVAFGLWYMLLFRLRKVRKESDSKVLYWTGGFMSDPRRSMFVKAIVMLANVGVIYALILLVYYGQGL